MSKRSSILLVTATLWLALAPGPLHAQGSGKTPTKAGEYLYTAETAVPARRQGPVTAGGINWTCSGSRCTVSGPWPTPGVSACQALAQQVGQIRSYGYPGRQLTSAELQQCNAGIAMVAPPQQIPEAITGQPLGPLPAGAVAPQVTGYSPAKVVVGETVAVLGNAFGAKSLDRIMRIGGSGYGRALDVVSWSSSRVEVRLPKDVRPGVYYIGVADASGRWLSNLERGLEVVDPLRRLPVRLEVMIGCDLDVVSSSPSVGIKLAPPSAEGRRPVEVSLAPAGNRPGPNGSYVFEYRGTVEVLIGGYRASAPASNFTVDFWDYINANSVPLPGGGRLYNHTPDHCYARRRLTTDGRRLPSPERQPHSVRLDRSVNVTAATSEIRLEAYTSRGTALGGGLPTPTPVCVWSDCP